MSQSLRIAVADDEPIMRRWYQSTLTQLGHEVVVAAGDGRELVEGCQRNDLDLVITDIEMPHADGITAAAEIREHSPLPIILVSAHHSTDYVERALSNHVLAYLVKPIKQPDLETAIALVIRRFAEFRAMQQEAESMAQALEDRKTIERAKGVLIERAGLDEPAAFRRLQKLSQERNQKLVEIARAVIEAERVLAPDDS